MSALITKLKKSRKTFAILVAVAFVPLIYAGTLTWANDDPLHNLDKVPAAIVNLDTPATVGDKTLNLGQTLTDELTSSTAENNFDWRSMDQDKAAAALESGEVLAVMTVPAGFSAAAASPADNDAATARPATLSVKTNDAANMIAGSIASSIASAVRDTLATQVSSEYLKNVYLGFADIHDAVAEAEGGAARLAEGTDSATEGSASLVAGLDQLADGTSLLASGARTLAGGAAEVDAGAQQLSAGLTTLQNKAAALPDRAAQLGTGAASAAASADELAAAVTQIETGAAALSTGADNALSAATRLSDGLDGLAAQSPALAKGANGVATGLSDLLADYDSLNDEQRKTILTALSDGATQVASGTQTVNTSASQLAAGGRALVGNEANRTGLAGLATGASTLATGAERAGADADQLKIGIAKVAAGAATLTSNLPELLSKISDAAAGVHALAGGTSEVSTGAAALADKTSALGTGAASAASGAADLHNGLVDLNDGAVQLSSGLAEGVSQIPTYTKDEAAALSKVTADPVRTDFTRINEVPAYGYALAPYFTALALWVGAISYFLIMPALTRRALTGRGSAFLVAARSFGTAALVAAAQSVLATLILVNGIGLNVANVWGLFGMIAFTSFTFVAINQALIALLGDPGRYIALILIVLQLSAAGGTYPIQTSPAFFQAIHPLFPLTYAVESFRSLIAGGSISHTQGFWVMGAWLLAALAMTALASYRTRRSISPPATVDAIQGA